MANEYCPCGSEKQSFAFHFSNEEKDSNTRLYDEESVVIHSFANRLNALTGRNPPFKL